MQAQEEPLDQALAEPVNVVLDQVYAMGTAFLEQLPQLAVAVVVLLLTWVMAAALGKLAHKLAERTNRRRSIQVLFRKIVNIAVWVVGIVISVTVVFPSITPGKLLTLLGLGGVAVGFAFKDVFENFLAGFLILTREPFKLGDFIEADDFEGWVDEITIRDTRLRQSDGQTIIMPNSQLFKNAVTVRTAGDRRRISLACGVGYGEDVGKARQIIREAVESAETVDTDKPVQVFASEFGASSVDFNVRWWTGSEPRELHESRDEVIEVIKKALDDAEIEIPFPYRTLTFAESLNIVDEEEAEYA